ncbi:MAG: Txe/YoeB family addiction module toxin [Quinella sp. 1Q5]|nr:Txe/YoeB family addiction module toxin [Quinella sp. 1Q5]
MNIYWDEKAWLEYLYWQTQDKKTLKRINNLLKDIDRNGYNCIGKPEPLKGELSGWWSVRIDEKNRLIFKIENEQIKINKCGTHYDDK